MGTTLVIVGASYAGVQLAASARERGYDGNIVLLGDEPEAPYQRPPLSKGFLTGSFAQERLPLRSPAFFDEERIEWQPSTRATRIDRTRREVALSRGTRIAYDHLALTTGARPRMLECPGASLNGVHCLRDLRDARRLALAARTARRAVIVGGGYIGLEAAASLRQMGVDVTVVETEARLLARVATPWMSDFIVRHHIERGVRCEFGRKVVALHGVSGYVTEVELDDGARLTCGLDIVGIGVVPNTELAAESGLEVAGGIVVDTFARTSDPAIVAAGDCASFSSHWLPAGSPMCRIESVQNANDMAKVAAASIMGSLEPHRAVPWFWSDQYDLKLQMAGLNTGWTDYVVRGSVAERKFSVYYFRGEQLAAVDSVNRPQDHMLARKLLANGASPSLQQIRDEGFDLKALAASAAKEVR
jgi:3-phenylpropionate/trans-cinnamate dioxygenase ferredoxin reductase subunit